MAKKHDVKVSNLDFKAKIEQDFISAMTKPNLDGLTIADLNKLLKESKKIDICGFMTPTKKKNPCYDTELSIKNFKGEIEISNDFTLSLKGNAIFSASDYAYGILEDDGQADLYFSGIWFADNSLKLSAAPPYDESGVLITTVEDM